MGREIRRIPSSWEHPRNEQGRYIPLMNVTFEDAARDWMINFRTWLEKCPTGFDADGDTFWDIEGNPPKRENHRPEWTEEPTAYQVYETVSDGTPVSPVFPTVEALRSWLISEWALSEKAADWFIQSEWSPSMIVTEKGISHPGAETIEAMVNLD